MYFNQFIMTQIYEFDRTKVENFNRVINQFKFIIRQEEDEFNGAVEDGWDIDATHDEFFIEWFFGRIQELNEDYEEEN